MFLQLFKRIDDDTELCYNLEVEEDPDEREMVIIKWLLDKPGNSILKGDNVKEVGPRLSWVSPWSSTVQSILTSLGIKDVKRIELSVRSTKELSIDRMTQQVYETPLTSFKTKPPYYKDNTRFIVKHEHFHYASDHYGFGWDEQDIKYYQSLFPDRLPRLIELFDLAQGNSEHCRHWFFNGKLTIDGKEQNYTLFDLVKKPWKENPGKSLLAFCDNASVREGANGVHLTFKAETHNFPTGISPHPGAETGVGGRQRDSMSVGRGGTLLAGTAGYCVGNLWKSKFKSQMESPLNILIQGSNGVSEYGNKFGEPLVQGFARTFEIGNRAWTKPILFSGGVGQIKDRDVKKRKPSKKDLVLKLGGPAYRIGMGGSTSSSRSETTEKDFNAVQRGDPLMNQKVYRVIQACLELPNNFIVTISDQGAGGNSNVLKELVDGTGAELELSKLNVGDRSMTPLELWVAEYQEAQALVLEEINLDEFANICERESCPFAVIGKITDTGRMIVKYKDEVIVDLSLNKVLEELPQKSYSLETKPKELVPFQLPEVGFGEMLNRVLQLPSVASKRYLVTKADRSVGGLVVQQQCVGPLQVPVSDYALMAQDFSGTTGVVTSIGEKPLLGLINVRKMARMAVVEAITNLMWAETDGLNNVKLSANWMWYDKDSELVSACKALSDFCCDLGVAIDGGKDSLSMRVNTDKGLVKAPGSLVISAYTLCPNIRNRVTPQISPNGEPIYLIYTFFDNNMGGSALAQVYDQIGADCPDVLDGDGLEETFNYVQELLKDGNLIAGHDRSDGGLIVTLLEMCFAGNCGMKLDLQDHEPEKFLFYEGMGVVVQVKEELPDPPEYGEMFILKLGVSTPSGFTININNKPYYTNNVGILRSTWERTSFLLDQKQSNPETAREEFLGLFSKQVPEYKVTHKLISPPRYILKPERFVGVLRTDGTNGHKEMAAAFQLAGFEILDIHTNDLIKNPNLLEKCTGLAFPGGFSFSDVLGAGKGFAALLKYNNEVRKVWDRFYERKDTFSLGVCNGFQLMVHTKVLPHIKLVKNKSQRFESRLVSVRIMKTNCVFFKGMEDSVLPVWAAHGEGKFMYSNKTLLHYPLMYTDHEGKDAIGKYPYSPNGSFMAGVCSLNGRHLGMMPHPERCFLDWQLPYNPHKWKTSPWLRMFENAYRWATKPQ
jgi:phosphoribosylformylglycinamidine synthase